MRSACLVATSHTNIFNRPLRSNGTQAHGLGIQPEYTSQAYRARYLQEVAPHATKG